MLTRTGLTVLLSLVTAILWTNPAYAQTAATLQPNTFRLQTGDALQLSWRNLGLSGLQSTTWPNQVDWLFVRGLGSQENLPETQPNASDGTLRITLNEPGATVVGLDRHPQVLELPARQLMSFAARRVSQGTAVAAQLPTDAAATVKVRQYQSSKLIVRVSQPEGVRNADSAAAQSKTGQRCEIRAFADPSLLRPGSDFPMRAYLRGGKLANVRVQATNETTGKTVTYSTDSSGIGNLHIAEAGVWNLQWHHMEPEPSPVADWNLYSATLRFEVQGGAE